MNAEKTAIRILAATALLLLAALIFLPRGATAQETIKDNDYLVATYPTSGGSDALYIADTRNGVLGVFVYDPAARALQVKGVRRLDDAFAPR